MKKIVLATAIAAAALTAQAPTVEQAAKRTAEATFTFVSAEANFETAMVKGVPFTGDFVTEYIQMLADGNRIRSENTTAYARDAEGRTRREITIGMMGAGAAGTAGKHIFINDPVAKIDYVLDPQDKTARKINIGAMVSHAVPTSAARDVVFNHRIEGPKDTVIERGPGGSVTMERAPLPAGIIMHGQAGAVISQRMGPGEGISYSSSAMAGNFRNEGLGKRMIEGVEAEGTRTTLTIPAGQIGNDLPLETVSERWYSSELKTVVLTTRKDPRTGESTYRLTNLRRGEPSRTLFELPADYKVITEDNFGPAIRMRVDKKQE